MGKLDSFKILLKNLNAEFVPFKATYKDLSRYILPRTSSVDTLFADEISKRLDSKDIIDSTATSCARTISAGFSSGLTSPAKKWFKLSLDIGNIDLSEEAKVYLANCEQIIRHVFVRSNLYTILPICYAEMAVFGTGAFLVEQDNEDVLNFTNLSIGTYRIANDRKGRARVFSRKFKMTTRQIVEKFGTDNISLKIKSAIESKNMEQKFSICHVIMANKNHNPNNPFPKFKKYISIYFEMSENEPLLESGYDIFPVLVGRWETEGNSAYGTNSPGITALGDVRQLQYLEKQALKAIEMQLDPPMVGPTSLRNTESNILPGEVTYLDEAQGRGTFRKAIDVNIRLNDVEGKQEQTRERIKKVFYEDLFLMISNIQRSHVTATEINEKTAERLLMLGSVIDVLSREILDPLLEIAISTAEQRGFLGEVPQELDGREFSIEYISIMAQAQKVSGIGSIDRLVQFMMNYANIDQEAPRKLNMEKIIDKYSDMLGIDPALLNDSKAMEAFREQDRQQAEQQQAMEQAQAGAAVAKDLANTPVDNESALSNILGANVGQ